MDPPNPTDPTKLPHYDWIHLYRTSGALIEKNDFVNNHATIKNYRGIYIKSSNTDAVVRFNYFTGNGSNIVYAVGIDYSTDHGAEGNNRIYQNVIVGGGGVEYGNDKMLNDKFYNNTIYQPWYDGVWAQEGGLSVSGSEIFNNIISGDPSVGSGYNHISWHGPTSVCTQAYLNNNLYFPLAKAENFRNLSNGYQSLAAWKSGLQAAGCNASTNESASRSADPKFGNAAARDFHLAADSPALFGGRGGTYPTVLGAYVTGNEQIGCSALPGCFSSGSPADTTPPAPPRNLRVE